MTRLSDKSISVATAKPIVITADTFGFGPGIAKLSEAVNGTVIATGATFTFDLLFETGDKLPELQAARVEAAKRKTAEETSTISAEACETRFSVISTAGAIYFKTGSAELDKESEPMLQSVADIANRCPGARIEVTGHTDWSAAGRPTSSCPSSGRARWSASCRIGALPPRASKRPATATRGRSCPMTARPIGPRIAASNSGADAKKAAKGNR